MPHVRGEEFILILLMASVNPNGDDGTILPEVNIKSIPIDKEIW